MAAARMSLARLPRPAPIAVLLALYTALALAYNFAQPPLEPPDEAYQFAYVRHLIETRQLPVVTPGRLSGFHHPPLYYALAAVLAAPFPAADFTLYTTERLNPYQGYRYWEFGVDNKNRYLHGPWDAPRWESTALALRVARLTSVLAGLATVWLTYRLGRLLFDEVHALTAAGLAAGLPMFLAVSGSLQGDAGATLVGAATLWLGARTILHGEWSARRAAVLGALVGLGTLMKLTGLFLAAPVVWAWLDWVAHTRPGVRRAVGHLAGLGAAAALVSGWWFMRNLALYGDPTAMNANLAAFGSQSVAEGVANWGPALGYAWTTFWGRFAHGEVNLPEPVYVCLWAPTLAAAVGAAWRGWRARRAAGPRWRVMAFLAVAGLAHFAALMGYLTLSPTGANARYTFPALPAYMLVAAAGLLAWAPRGRRGAMGLLLVGGMLAFGLAALVGVVIPAYAPPAALTALPPEAKPVNLQLADVAILRGYHVQPAETAPGTAVTLTLYWEPLNQTGRPYSVFVHLINTEDGALLAQRDTFPGLGRYPTTAWTPGQLFADQYRVPLPADTPAAQAYWKVGLWQAETGDYAWVLDAAGAPSDSGVPLGAPLIIR